MIKIFEQFWTFAAAKEWAENYVDLYHPCGYGTRLTIIRNSNERTFDVYGHRFASCD